ncbi:hypothetical protein [Natrinema sp. H-ect4]|uniref:hypothetical protein n=1 Tax=Natrinema sp. H-ect4 TaxID=3242699 RepID=UPI0035A83733
MSNWTIEDQETGETWEKDSRKEAEDAIEMFGDERNLELVPPGESAGDEAATDGGTTAAEVPAEHGVPQEDEDDAAHPQGPPARTTGEMETADATPDDVSEAVELQGDGSVPLEDPLSMLPGWMITEVSYNDRGDNSTTVNKRGCQVIARALDIEVQTTAVTRASESDFEVEETQTFLDDLVIQSGLVAGEVPKEEELVLTDEHEIETESRTVSKTVASEWVADVDGRGWVLADRTHTSDLEHEPDWPFNEFSKLAGREIAPVRLKPWEFVRNQRDAGRTWTVEMTTHESNLDDTTIEWGNGALRSKAVNSDVGVALTTFWNNIHVRLVIYSSGYIAIWEPAEMKPEMLGRFLHEEIVPIATFDDEAEVEEKQEAEQKKLEESGAEA